jgi:hypothetical protein
MGIYLLRFEITLKIGFEITLKLRSEIGLNLFEITLKFNNIENWVEIT